MPEHTKQLPNLGDTTEICVSTMSSPVGELWLAASATGLRALMWPGEYPELQRLSGPKDIGDKAAATAILEQAKTELEEYFSGERQSFSIPLDPVGTEFQLAAWQVLRTIPYGETISYGDQARALGDIKKSRAVGGANGRNPISIIVPCHRVVGANGKLTGFGGGLDTKSWLLHHEAKVSAQVLV